MTPSTDRWRVPAIAWHLERLYGAKVPQCKNCGSHDLIEDYVNLSFRCRGCSFKLSHEHGVDWVPADPNVRLPNEEDTHGVR